MMNMRLFLISCICFALPAVADASPVAFPAWGFFIDLPEEYSLTEGDMASAKAPARATGTSPAFSFASEAGGIFNLKLYEAGKYASVEAMAQTIQKQLNNKGESEVFEYRKKKAAILELSITNGNTVLTGYGLCLELDTPPNSKKNVRGTSFLLALAYGTSDGLSPLHLSCLDSIALNAAALRAPGPITEYSCPRETRKTLALAGFGENAVCEAAFFERDAEAAQFVVDREDMVLQRYAKSPLWKEAWRRFYRAIYRDSFERLQNAAFILERTWNIPESEDLAFADKALKWVQGFAYERDTDGSDFVNLVTAATEGRGDCDSRALLWAVILEQAGIRAAIMVSAEYSHAMGLVDTAGAGARFEFENRNWLVAETTDQVDLGLINSKTSDQDSWIGINFY